MICVISFFVESIMIYNVSQRKIPLHIITVELKQAFIKVKVAQMSPDG